MTDYKQALAAMEITYRALTENDAEDYRALRIKALETDGHWYTADKDAEKRQTLEDWRRACAETTQHITFAVFDGDRLVATTQAAEHQAYIGWWRSTFIEPEYRKAGIAEVLFDMCAEWSLDHGCTEVMFTVREDNRPARKIHERGGAIPLGQRIMDFADGTKAPTLLYRKKLKPRQAHAA